MKTYREKLEDPRWQKKRLQVFERDKFRCVACLDGTKTLHVHHLAYHREPWEAAMEELSTLCEGCHGNLEEAIRMLRENPRVGILPHLINRALQLHDSEPGKLTRLLRELIG